MATILRIKRSGSTGSATSLKLGELAYSYLTGTQSNGGDRLYIGEGGVDSTGDANNIAVIGGEYFTNMLDHVNGTLTASSAIITDASNKIDVLNVDNLTLDGNAITSTNTDGNITLTPNGNGEVVASTLTVSDLTNQRIVVAGASGALSDNGNLTFNGSVLTATAAVDITGDLDVDNVNINGNTISATDTNGSLTLTKNGTGTVIVSGTTALQVPAGTTAERPSAVTGQIRFNSTISAFEGYHGTSWNSLGGLIDVDQDTKITAENSAGADSDALKFFTGGTLRMTLDSDKLSFDGINKLITSSGSSFTIDPNPSGDSGELIILGNLTVEGTTTTINSTVVSINDRAMVLADSATDSAGANNAGIIINGPAIKPSILYKSATDTFSLSKPFTQPASGSVENLLANYTTDNVAEGSSNLYFTNERVDDRLNNLLLAGEAIDLTYNDGANTLQIDVELATKSNPGAASFDSDQMTVTSGAVTITELDGGTY